jgi:hypothetical protein
LLDQGRSVVHQAVHRGRHLRVPLCLSFCSSPYTSNDSGDG